MQLFSRAAALYGPFMARWQRESVSYTSGRVSGRTPPERVTRSSPCAACSCPPCRARIAPRAARIRTSSPSGIASSSKGAQTLLGLSEVVTEPQLELGVEELELALLRRRDGRSRLEVLGV